MRGGRFAEAEGARNGENGAGAADMRMREIMPRKRAGSFMRETFAGNSCRKKVCAKSCRECGRIVCAAKNN